MILVKITQAIIDVYISLRRTKFQTWEIEINIEIYLIFLCQIDW